MALAFLAATGRADPIEAHWLPGLSNDAFENAARWSIGFVPRNGTPPGATYHAIFPGAFFTTSLTSSVTLDRMSLFGDSVNGLFGTLAIRAGGRLEISDWIDCGLRGRLSLEGGSLVGGTVNTGATGLFRVVSNSRAEGVTVNGTMEVGSGRTLTIASGLGVSGVLSLVGGRITAENSQILAGNATVIFDAASPSRIGSISAGAGATLTLASSLTFRSVRHSLGGQGPL